MKEEDKDFGSMGERRFCNVLKAETPFVKLNELIKLYESIKL